MKTIICELCEGTSFTKQGDIYVCNSCSAQFSIEDVKKMMKEVDGDVPVTTEKSPLEFDKYILLARRASSSGNDADAAKYYGFAQTENPNDWESVFFGAYHTAMQTNIAGIASAATLVVGSIDPTVSLIENYTSEVEQLDAAIRLVDACTTISTMLLTSAVNHYNGIDSSIRSRYENECRQRAVSARLIPLTAAACLDKAFGDDDRFHDVIAIGYKYAILMHENNSIFVGNVNFDELRRIAKYDKEFAAPRLQRRVNTINTSIKQLSKKTTNSGCAGLLYLVIALGFIIWGMHTYNDAAYYFYVVGAVFGIIAILAMIPFKKSAKVLAQNEAEIKELKTQKEEITNWLNEI